MRYELLQEGDVIKEGDQFFGINRTWMSCSHLVGNTQNAAKPLEPIRRPIPDKPKVRLEELIGFARECFDQSTACNNSEVWGEVIKSICAQLGVELEEPKEEWEIAWEKQLQTAGFKDQHERERCMADFRNGWQACEQRKEK